MSTPYAASIIVSPAGNGQAGVTISPGGLPGPPPPPGEYVLQGAGGLVFNATSNGLLCDGSTDDTAALSTLLSAVAAFGGGTIFFPSLSKILGQIVLPATVSGGGQLQQAPVRLLGTVPNRPGESESGVTYPSGGLDLRYAGRTDTGCGTTAGSNVVTDASAVAGDYGQIIISPGNLPDRTYIMAVTPGVGYSLNNGARATNASASFTIGGGKLQALGIGTLELDHMLLCDQGTSSQPFVLATGTTVDMHHCAVLGNTAKTSGTCDQDPVVLGGPGQGTALTTPLTSGSPVTTIAVSALPVALNAGASVVITNGTNTQVITTSAAAVGATSITSSFTPNANYGTGSAVLFGGQQAAVGGTAYSVPAANMQGYGSHIHDNFFQRVRRILLQTWTADVTIDENIWWQNCGSNLARVPSTLTTAVTVSGSPYTSLAVTALPAAVAAGDQIQLGTNSPGSVTAVTSQVATASVPAAAGATSVSINSFTATGTYAIGTKVINTTAGISAPIEVYAALGNASNIVAANNHFDMTVNWSYGVRLGATVYESTITGNGLYNANAANIAGYRFDTGAQFNTLIPGILTSTVPMVDDQSAVQGSQTVLRPQQSQPSLLPQGLITQGGLSRYTDAQEPPVYDAAGDHWYQQMATAAWIWNYIPLAGGTNQVAKLTWAASTTVLDLLTTAGNTAYVRNFSGTLLLTSDAGYHIGLGDATRQTDVIVLNGNLQVTHLLAQGTAPTVAAASSSTGLSIAGQDTAHNVALTTAASIGAGASVATITFGLSYATRAPSLTPRFAVTPKNLTSALAQPLITGDGQAGYAIALANPPAGATAMAFDILVIAS